MGKKENRKIANVVVKAKEYIAKGYNYTDAVKQANEDVVRAERDKYEK